MWPKIQINKHYEREKINIKKDQHIHDRSAYNNHSKKIRAFVLATTNGIMTSMST